MKSILIFIFGAIVGFVIGGKLGYDYVTSQVVENAPSIIGSLINGNSTGGSIIPQQYEQKAQELLDDQKQSLKEEMKKQLNSYIDKKINSIFAE